jgi:hypothetical protein
MMPLQLTTLAKTPNLTLNVLIRKSASQLLHLKPNKQMVQKRNNQTTTLLSGAQANMLRDRAICKGGRQRMLYQGGNPGACGAESKHCMSSFWKQCVISFCTPWPS